MKSTHNKIPVLDPRTIGAQIQEKAPSDLRKDIHDFPQPDKFIITKIEESAPYIKFPIPLHRRNQYECVFVTEGHAIRTKGLNIYKISKNTLFLLPPDQITSTDFVSKNCRGYFWMFDAAYFYYYLKTDDYLNQFPFFKMGSHPLIKLSDKSLPDMLFLMEKLREEFLSDRVKKHHLIVTLINAILLEAEKYYIASEEDPATDETSSAVIVSKFKNLLSKYLIPPKSVKEYADILYITPNHLNRCVKENTGKTAGALIIEMQTLEAKILLKQTGLTVSEIATHLGFDDISYFSRFFKKSTGMRPLEYRKNA